MTVLVTGGAGYIGSHTCVELLEQGMDVVVIDNLVNSSAKSLERVEQITGKRLAFYQEDVRDRAALDRIFEKHDIGWHDEGSQGMLHVFPEYRRRGFAEALERQLINFDLSRGYTPFGQLFIWNDASRRLQEKLGMDFADGHICWLWKEKE